MREILGKVLDCQKVPRKLSGIQFSHKNKLPKPRGKTAYKDSKKGAKHSLQISVGCPSRKNLILKYEDFRMSKTFKLYIYAN